MMLNRCVATLALLTLLFTASFSIADELKFGQEFKGDLGGTPKSPFGPGWYVSESTISLTAGQSIKLWAEVTGKDRIVEIKVLDPTGAVIPSSVNGYKIRKYEALVEEVHATGKYKIIVGSTLIGKFNLKVTDASIDEESVEYLEKRRKELQAELKQVEEKLAAAKKR